VNLSGNPIFGDPKQLESVKLSDLHPASWYVVLDIVCICLGFSNISVSVLTGSLRFQVLCCLVSYLSDTFSCREQPSCLPDVPLPGQVGSTDLLYRYG
jgi:hypothetical protein